MERWIIAKGTVLLDNGYLLIIARDKPGQTLKVSGKAKIIVEEQEQADEDTSLLE